MTEPAGMPTVKIDQTPKHKLHHRELRRKKQEWERMRVEGFTRCHNKIEIDDRKIALQQGMCFYELKSFGMTMAWSLDKVQVINAYHGSMRSHIENRLDPKGNLQRYIVMPSHLKVYEYNPATGHKIRLNPKKDFQP
jgi:hypothetical protein